jgi:pimeloyl-ACP methyl ester carboxylesterase
MLCAHPNGSTQMTFPIHEHVVKTSRHTTFYLASGALNATPIIFLHGWPELSISWRHQLPVFGALGFRAIAPDMRGYGRSSVYARHDDYALEHVVADMLELLDALGVEKAIWVGHDWGSPVVWSIAQHHPDRCHGVANLCVAYLPNGFTTDNAIALADRTLYPEDKFPAAQWDYQLFHQQSFATAVAAFEANVRATVKVLFRAGSPAGKGKPSLSAFTRASGGFFRGAAAPDVPRDETVLTLDDEHRYTAALQRNGFFGPDSWYMNQSVNAQYAERARPSWRLNMPVLFLHASYDYICATVDSPRATAPMRDQCPDLTEAVVESGHWMAQEKPADVNAALAKWLSVRLPTLWPRQ